VPLKVNAWKAISNKKLSWCWQTRRLEVSQGHQTCIIRFVRYGFLLVCYSIFVPDAPFLILFWLQKMSWPWNPGQRSLKIIGTDTDRSATCDVLLTLHNHEPISYRFQDKRRFQSKIANFPNPCI